MTKLTELFLHKKQEVLNIYVTAGYPKLNDTVTIMKALQQSGADIIELGMPYSDPLADGDTIQQSSAVALQNGMSIPVLINQLQSIRDYISILIVLMGYLNPILQYGFEKFCRSIKAVGVDALIIPDLPILEYEQTYGSILKEYDIDFIFLITPQTPEVRIKKIDSISSGFIYAVTSSSTTGSEQNFDQVTKYLDYVKSLQLRNPILAGFGISDQKSFELVSAHCNGGIIGSAFIKSLAQSTNVESTTIQFISALNNDIN